MPGVRHEVNAPLFLHLNLRSPVLKTAPHLENQEAAPLASFAVFPYRRETHQASEHARGLRNQRRLHVRAEKRHAFALEWSVNILEWQPRRAHFED